MSVLILSATLPESFLIIRRREQDNCQKCEWIFL